MTTKAGGFAVVSMGVPFRPGGGLVDHEWLVVLGMLTRTLGSAAASRDFLSSRTMKCVSRSGPTRQSAHAPSRASMATCIAFSLIEGR